MRVWGGGILNDYSSRTSKQYCFLSHNFALFCHCEQKLRLTIFFRPFPLRSRLLKYDVFAPRWDSCSFCRNVLPIWPYYISKGHITPDLGHFIFRSEKYELFSQNFVNILKNFVNILCFFGSILDLTLVCKENFRPVGLLSVYDDDYCSCSPTTH